MPFLIPLTVENISNMLFTKTYSNILLIDCTHLLTLFCSNWPNLKCWGFWLIIMKIIVKYFILMEFHFWVKVDITSRRWYKDQIRSELKGNYRKGNSHSVQGSILFRIKRYSSIFFFLENCTLKIVLYIEI